MTLSQTRLALLGTFIVGTLATATAHAQDAVPGQDKPKKAKKAKIADGADASADDKGKLTVGGRVFLRETLSSSADAPWQAQLTVASARAEVDYRWRMLRAVVEVEASSGNARLRDAFLRADLPRHFELRGGQFKVPLSILENESAWSLPTVGRGLLSEILDGSFHITGRRPGFMAAWRSKGDSWRPNLRLAAFQGEDLGGNPVAGKPEDGLGLDVAARAGLAYRSGGSSVELGVGGSLRVQQPPPGHHWAATVDFQVDQVANGMGLRLWLEGFAGELPSTFDTTPETVGDPVFASGRGLIAWRAGGVTDGELYVEPYAMGSLTDPNVNNARDAIWEIAGGVALGQWKRWRVQLQLEAWRKYSLTSAAFAVDGLPLANRDAVVAQVGAAF